MAQLTSLSINDTGFLKLASGNGSQRPVPAAGMVRYNSSRAQLEGYVGSQWIPLTYSIPNAMTSGLIMNLDAGLPSSYSGTGTAWNDISGNNRNVTLLNTVVYNTDTQGNLVFNGTNYGSVSGITSTSTLTVNLMVKVASDPGGFKGIIGANDGTNNDYQIGFNIDLAAASGTGIDLINIEGNGISYGNHLSAPIAFNQWFNLCAVISSTTATLYINGVAQITSTRTSAATMATSFLTIGARPVTGTGQAASYAFNGSIASAQLYNRALTQQEVKNNFLQYADRFGVAFVA